MTETLFVYGTLMPNCPHEHILKNVVGKFIPATVRGYLKDAGWSASMGYPGIHLDKNGDTIHRFLFYSSNLINHWDYLDEFESEEFKREEILATRYDEFEVNTYIYVLNACDEIIEEV